MDIKEVLLQPMVYKFFETKSAGANTSGGVSMLKRQLDKYIIKNFSKT